MESTWRCLFREQNLPMPGSPCGLAPGQVLRRRSPRARRVWQEKPAALPAKGVRREAKRPDRPVRSRCWECRGSGAGREVQNDRPLALRTRGVGDLATLCPLLLRSDTSAFHEAPGLGVLHSDCVDPAKLSRAGEAPGWSRGHPDPDDRAVPPGGTVFPQNCRPRTRAGLSTPEGWVQ